MFTIDNNSEYELIVKNSKFITCLFYIDNINNINNILNSIKNKYPAATHYCYAYIIDDVKKSSDDGEPSGTAGLPILKVLEANNLNHILAIVVRYFGGIKLGANGLIRAYTKCISNSLKDNKIVELLKGYNINIIFNYNDIKQIDYLLKDIKINSKDFKTNITYNIDIPIAFLDTIKNNNIKYQILNNIYIKKI